MRSLKSQLIVWTTAGTVSIFAAACVFLYFLVRTSLVGQCDSSLLVKGHFVSRLIEQDEGKVHLEFEEFDASHFDLDDDRAYLQVRLTDGTSVYRSPTLGRADLNLAAAPAVSVKHGWVKLPNGKTGRAVRLDFTPNEKGKHKKKKPRSDVDSRQRQASVDPANIAPDGAKLIISEFLAIDRVSIAGQPTNHSDWIEIHNRSNSPVDLEGWYLTDQPDTAKWRFPDVTIPAGAFMLVFASGQDLRDPSRGLHANFKMDAKGEYLALIRPDGHTVESAYSPKYPPQIPGVSYGLSGDLGAAGYFRWPTPGANNDTERSRDPPEPVEGPLTLVLAREAPFIGNTLTRLVLLLIVVGTATVPVLVLILRLGVRRSLRSLDELAAKISQLRSGEFDEVICLSRCPHELQPVIARLNQLLQQLNAVLQRERGFSSDVAHELRTPLAALLLKMDLVLSRRRQPSEYQVLVADCREVASQMRNMIEKLLVLARLEASGVAVQSESLLLDDVIREAWKPLSNVARQRRLSVNWALQPQIQMVTDRTQLGLAVRNVLENAVAHSNEGGSVRIKSGCDDGRVTFEVRNGGSVVAVRDADSVFKRFWRGDEARSDGVVHSGLGLPITKRMVEILGGSVTARSRVGGDFEITIHLPVKPQPTRRITSD